MATEILLPEMGEGIIEGTLTRWLVQEGDDVEQFEPIAEVETDKVTTEITSEVGGRVLRLCVAEGQTVAVETTLAIIGSGEEPTAVGKSQEKKPASGNGQTPLPVASPEPPHPANHIYSGRISPVVGRMAAEHQLDLGQIPGTGRDGRITKRDVLAFLEKKSTESPSDIESDKQITAPGAMVPVSEEPVPLAAKPLLAAGEELLPHSGMRLAIAEHMVRSKRTSPHVTTVFEFDFASVAAHRAVHKEQFAADGTRLTYTVYLIAATIQALKEHPLANSRWSDEGIILNKVINIGMAVAVPDGLIVPVIKGADGLNLLGLARAINDLTDRARDKKLKPDDVKGGTFSITNHGTTGSLLATPIINQPQAGILGIGKIEKRVKVIGDAIAIRPLAFASFTFDHRILDGASADAFVSRIKVIIENWT